MASARQRPADGSINRVGLEALYLSLDPTTAVAEFKQASAHLPPGTLCSYTATLPALVDLRQLGAGSWHPIWHDWNIDWRLIRADGRMDPPTWDMADLALDAGAPGSSSRPWRIPWVSMSCCSSMPCRGAARSRSMIPTRHCRSINRVGVSAPPGCRAGRPRIRWRTRWPRGAGGTPGMLVRGAVRGPRAGG